MSVMIFHEQLAYLWELNKRRALSPKEMKEVRECMEANANYVWKMAQLENWSTVAYMIDDMDWFSDICRQIDELEMNTKKSAPQRKTDRKKKEQ